MEKQWFAIHTYSSFEKRVKQTIEHRMQLEGLSSKVAEVRIPEKKTVEIRNGKKMEVMRNLMPGYVFIHMEPNDDVFAIIQKINGVSSFLGDESGKPSALPQSEVDAVMESIEERPDKPKTVINYQVNDQVKVIEGPFANFVGTVEQVDQEKGKLKVMVSIFGRPTSVELDVLQVENT